MATSRMHTYDEWCAQFYAPALLQPEEQQYERTPGAHLVFNHRLFQEWVRHAPTSSLIYSDSLFLRLRRPQPSEASSLWEGYYQC